MTKRQQVTDLLIAAGYSAEKAAEEAAADVHPEEPTETRREAALAMPCPRCGAWGGEPCIGVRRAPRSAVHAERMALSQQVSRARKRYRE